MDSGYIWTLFRYGQWLYQDIVDVWTVVLSRHCLCMISGDIWKCFMHGQWLYQYIVYTLFMYGHWLYQYIDYVWIMVITECLCMGSGYIRHCLYMKSGYIYTLFVHGQL